MSYTSDFVFNKGPSQSLMDKDCTMNYKLLTLQRIDSWAQASDTSLGQPSNHTSVLSEDFQNSFSLKHIWAHETATQDSVEQELTT